MSSNLSVDLEQFHQFIGAKLANGGSSLSPEQALDEWRAEHPTLEELNESVAVIRKSLADMEAGDTGRPAGEVIADLRRKYCISPDR